MALNRAPPRERDSVRIVLLLQQGKMALLHSLTYVSGFVCSNLRTRSQSRLLRAARERAAIDPIIFRPLSVFITALDEQLAHVLGASAILAAE